MAKRFLLSGHMLILLTASVNVLQPRRMRWSRASLTNDKGRNNY